ncbi:MAG: hypothetical protein WDZ35_02240 [Crocinitomicaceae bacterium]
MPEELPQPQDIPWQPICVSRDMMDPTFCNGKFPIAWRSSLAISAYEPDPADLPDPFCAGKLTYIKVTASITGYQPTDQELNDGYTEFGNTPVEEILDDIFDTYFGCYGALLNIAVFPNSTKEWKLEAYPKIFEFEPKNRELIQNSVEQGEILTSSKNDVSTGHSFTSTNTVSSGITASTNIGGNELAEGASNLAGSTWGAGIEGTHEWGETNQDSSNVNIDNSQERSEKQATTTNIEQLYNLLSGYHSGTNRAVLFMLPRPHLLQPTNRRTFAQGLRIIEGIQEFFFVVVRDPSMEGICIEAKLDTGHYPENVQIQEPEVKYDESTVTFNVSKHADNGGLFNNPQQTPLDTVYTVPSGWVIDTRVTPSPIFPKGDAGHVGITDTDAGSNSQGAPINYNYQAISPTQVFVSGYIEGAAFFGPGAIFNHNYTVHLRSENPIPSDIGETIDIGNLFTTTRNLCCCFYKDPALPCLSIGKLIGPIPPLPDTTYTSIKSQRQIKIPKNLLEDITVNKSMAPAVKALLKEIKSAMITAREGKFSYTDEADHINFLDSDYFVAQILPKYPSSVLTRLLSAVRGLDPQVVAAFGTTGTIEDALSLGFCWFFDKNEGQCSNCQE